MRLFIAGQKAFGAAVLELALGLGHDVAAVAAPEANSDGRPDRLRMAAERFGAPTVSSDRLRAELLPAGVDLIVAAHSHAYIGRRTRLKALHGAVGYHPSLLPRHRGRDAVRWAIHMGDRVSGGTVYWLGENVDGGDIAAQDFVHIAPADTASTLWSEKLFPLGLALIERVLRDVAAGVIRRQPQDERYATWEPAMERAPLWRPELELIGPAPGGLVVLRQAARV